MFHTFPLFITPYFLFFHSFYTLDTFSVEAEPSPLWRLCGPSESVLLLPFRALHHIRYYCTLNVFTAEICLREERRRREGKRNGRVKGGGGKKEREGENKREGREGVVNHNKVQHSAVT